MFHSRYRKPRYIGVSAMLVYIMPIIGRWSSIPYKPRYIGIWEKLEALIYVLSGLRLLWVLGYIPGAIKSKYGLPAVNKLILARRSRLIDLVFRSGPAGIVKNGAMCLNPR